MKLGIPYMGSKRKLASEILKVERIFWNGKGEANKHTLF